ncbi:sodium/proline symporter [Elusimicrobiota bacterium]
MDSQLIGLCLYLAAVLGVAFFASRRMNNISDYLLGGRKLGTWVITLSERASGESAWLLVGLPGAVLAAGTLEIWTVVGCIAGIIFSWWVIAFKLREETGRYNALTLPEYFACKFGDKNNLLRITASAIITFFFMFYVAAQFSGAGKVLNVTFGISEFNGMLIGAAIILFYTVLGGFFAVALTDVIQGIIMLGTLVVIPIVGIIELGGLANLESALANVDSALVSPYGAKTGFAALLVAIGGLSWGLGYMGQPHLVARYMAIDKAENLKRGRFIAAGWSLFAFFGAFFMGLAGLALYGNIFSDPEKLMPYMAMNLLPGWTAGIFISGAIAAMMSTADSQLLVTTSVLSEDIYYRLHKKNVGEKNLVRISRYITLLVGTIAFILAITSKQLVFYLVSFAWSGLGASFGPALLLALWWKRVTREGILAGMLTGSLTTIIWANIPFLRALMTERVISFGLAFLMVIVVSLAFSKRRASCREK